MLGAFLSSEEWEVLLHRAAAFWMARIMLEAGARPEMPYDRSTSLAWAAEQLFGAELVGVDDAPVPEGDWWAEMWGDACWKVEVRWPELRLLEPGEARRIVGALAEKLAVLSEKDWTEFLEWEGPVARWPYVLLGPDGFPEGFGFFTPPAPVPDVIREARVLTEAWKAAREAARRGQG